VQKLIDELGINCRIRSVPYPMLDIIARSMERFGNKSAKEPAFTHYGVSKLNFDFTLISPAPSRSWAISRWSRWMKGLSAPPRG
jgi:hypothetical protein